MAPSGAWYWTEERLTEFRNTVAECTTWSEVFDLYPEHNPETLRRVATRHGIRLSAPRRFWTPERVEQLRQLMRSSRRWSQVTPHFPNQSVLALRKAARRHGINTDFRGASAS